MRASPRLAAWLRWLNPRAELQRRRRHRDAQCYAQGFGDGFQAAEKAAFAETMRRREAAKASAAAVDPRMADPAFAFAVEVVAAVRRGRCALEDAERETPRSRVC